MKLSPGKRKRAESVSDSGGVIAALAIDQRDTLRKLFFAELKIKKQAVPSEHLLGMQAPSIPFELLGYFSDARQQAAMDLPCSVRAVQSLDRAPQKGDTLSPTKRHAQG